MSCVVAITDGKKVYMAAESAATSMEGDRRLIVPSKIIKNGPYLIGYSGSVRTGQLLDPHFFKPPRNILDMPDAMLELLEAKKSLSYSETQTALLQCNIIIGYKNKIYEILADFQLNEPAVEYVAVGSGACYAFGSLSTTSSLQIVDIKHRLTMALDSACLFSADCKGPYNYEST